MNEELVEDLVQVYPDDGEHDKDECVYAAHLLWAWEGAQAGEVPPIPRRRGTTYTRGRRKRKRGGGRRRN